MLALQFSVMLTVYKKKDENLKFEHSEGEMTIYLSYFPQHELLSEQKRKLYSFKGLVELQNYVLKLVYGN